MLFALLFAGCAKKRDEPGNTTRDGRLAPALKNLGNLHHAITTKSPDAQKFFNQGLTLVYGFNHAEAVRSFKEAARIDPQCAMAYWGLALALAPNINDPAIGADREQQGHHAAAEAMKRKAGASESDQAFIDAITTRFSTAKGQDREALNNGYADAMKRVYARFPDDPDVTAIYADAVMNTMPWDYWTKKGEPKPGIAEVRRALETSMKQQKGHPGTNHLYIHLMEASPEVDQAVPSADRLGSLVPAAGHLVHMPAHIYARVGRWDDAATANEKAISADEDYITQCRAQGIYPAVYYPHNVHFLNAVLAMNARSREALESSRKLAGKHDHAALNDPSMGGFAHLLKSVPLLTMVRFGRWDEILREAEPPADQIFARAMRNFARGYAFSAQSKSAEAKQELDLLKKSSADPSLANVKILGLNSLAQMAGIAIAMLEGEIARRSKSYPQAIAAYRKAVEIDDGLLYSEPPDWMLPPRQYLGETLLAAGRFKEAERVYREDLDRHRDNGWSLVGLEQSLRSQGLTRQADGIKAKRTKTSTRADIQLSASRL